MKFISGVSNRDLFLFNLKKFPHRLQTVVLWPFYAAFICSIPCYILWHILPPVFYLFVDSPNLFVRCIMFVIFLGLVLLWGRFLLSTLGYLLVGILKLIRTDLFILKYKLFSILLKINFNH